MRSRPPALIGFGAVFIALGLMTRCSSSDSATSTSPDAAADSASGGSMMLGPPDGADEGTSIVIDLPFSDATPDHGAVSSPDGGTCSGSDASVCELPASVCADSQWLAYFTNATCAAGQCRWDIAYRDCGVVGCFGHGCSLNITR